MQEFKAYGALRPNGRLEPFSFDPGQLGPEEVEIKVSHCGLCHSDLSMLDNEWGMSQYSFVPGHEVTGTVVALGEAAKGLKIGQRVGLGWFAHSCLACHECLSGDQHLCATAQGTLLGAMAALRIVFELSGHGFALCPMRWTWQKWDRSCAAVSQYFRRS
jgi:alcohol/geraniol dehydrogenase (NADP+)